MRLCTFSDVVVDRVSDMLYISRGLGVSDMLHITSSWRDHMSKSGK